MIDPVHPLAARFDAAADAYERGRPGYPPEAVEAIAAFLDLRPGRSVLDLAAGTGKMTRSLVPTGARVVAVEPVAGMRAQLEALNKLRFSDGEWQRFFAEKIAGRNEGIVEKTARIQEDHIQVLRRDDGRVKNVYLLDKQHGIVAFELAKGQMLWTDDNRLTPRARNPQVSMVWLGNSDPAGSDAIDRAICLNEKGELILIRLTPQGLTEDSRAKILGDTWAHPAYAGEHCYARDDERIVCVRLTSAPAAE